MIITQQRSLWQRLSNQRINNELPVPDMEDARSRTAYYIRQETYLLGSNEDKYMRVAELYNEQLENNRAKMHEMLGDEKKIAWQQKRKKPFITSFANGEAFLDAVQDKINQNRLGRGGLSEENKQAILTLYDGDCYPELWANDKPNIPHFHGHQLSCKIDTMIRSAAYKSGHTHEIYIDEIGATLAHRDALAKLKPLCDENLLQQKTRPVLQEKPAQKPVRKLGHWVKTIAASAALALVTGLSLFALRSGNNSAETKFAKTNTAKTAAAKEIKAKVISPAVSNTEKTVVLNFIQNAAEIPSPAIVQGKSVKRHRHIKSTLADTVIAPVRQLAPLTQAPSLATPFKPIEVDSLLKLTPVHIMPIRTTTDVNNPGIQAETSSIALKKSLKIFKDDLARTVKPDWTQAKGVIPLSSCAPLPLNM